MLLPRFQHVSVNLDPIYAKFLKQADESFATECAEARLFGLEALGDMTQIPVATSEQRFSACDNQDEYLGVDTYSWHECLQVIEDHEWSSSISSSGESVRIDDSACSRELCELNPVSSSDILDPAPSTQTTNRDVETSVLPADTSRNHPPSFFDPENEFASKPAMLFVTHPASAIPNTSERTFVMAETEDTLMEETGPEEWETSPTVTIEVTARISHGNVEPEVQCARSSDEVSHEAKRLKFGRSGQTPEVTTSTRVIEYPPTPAMSDSDLQPIVEDVHNTLSPATEHKPTETVHCKFDSGMATTPSPLRATLCYCPPTVTDERENNDMELVALPVSGPTAPYSHAADGQVILCPPLDWYQTYIARGLVTRSQLLEHDEQVNEIARAAFATPLTIPSTQAASVPSNNGSVTPPASPISQSQEPDLTFVMAALASYSLSPQMLTQAIKRSFTSTETDVDVSEEHAAKRQKLSKEEPVSNEPDREQQLHPAQNDIQKLFEGSERMAAADIEDDAKLGSSTSEAHAVSSTEGLISDTVLDVPLDISAHVAFEGPRKLHPQSHESQIKSVCPVKQLAGEYIQAPDVEMEQCLTTASMSTTLASSPLPPTSCGCSKIELKPLKLLVDSTELIKSEATDIVEHQHSALGEHLSDAEDEEQKMDSETQESEELTEVDDEELSLLSTVMEVADGPTSQDPTPPTKKSTPAPLAISRSDTAAKIPHEAGFRYERRATRSETRTSDRGPARKSPAEEEKDPMPALTIKEEDEPTPNPKTTNGTATKAKGRQTRSAEPPPKRTAVTAVKPSPKPKPKTPAPPDPPSATIKARKTTPKPHAASTESVLGKRKTRRSAALEEEMRKASEVEGNIAKRLTSKDAD
ncbi:Proteoglycan-4 [Didymella heteroderae]|uniref:Proteoglycan-4 n=1 Tax=Didymella heteroderae TaxID=1769908 RepID=A0A9P4WHT6_9PLEO|nr:Proteoglycan-4 [Didymella heteroderae]